MHDLDITVAICTYNDAERIPDVLDALARQEDTEKISWEILIIDNNSQDETRQVAGNSTSWGSSLQSIRYLFEPEQGLAFARSRAIKEAKGSWAAFLDDENIPSESWLIKATEFANMHPKIGAFGGKIHGLFETPPPEDFGKIAIFLALVDRGETAHCYTPQKRMLPPGAGLVIRREAWLQNISKPFILTGRTQNSFMAGEDLEVLDYIQKADWEIWYNPSMIIHHKTPKSRLEEKYLLELAWGIGICRHHIRVARYKAWKILFLASLHILNDFFQLLKFISLNGNHSRKGIAYKF